MEWGFILLSLAFYSCLFVSHWTVISIYSLNINVPNSLCYIFWNLSLFMLHISLISLIELLCIVPVWFPFCMMTSNWFMFTCLFKVNCSILIFYPSTFTHILDPLIFDYCFSSLNLSVQQYLFVCFQIWLTVTIELISIFYLKDFRGVAVYLFSLLLLAVDGSINTYKFFCSI